MGNWEPRMGAHNMTQVSGPRLQPMIAGYISGVSRDPFLPFRDALGGAPDRAMTLATALAAGDRDAAWRVKCEPPRFRGRSMSEVDLGALGLPDAELVTARELGFGGWEDLLSFSDRSRRDPSLERFELAVDAIVSGDAATLRALLQEDPSLVHARS